jgi:hypothetical protein
MGGVLYDSCFLPVCGLFAVAGRCENSDARGLVGLSVFGALVVDVNVSEASGARGRGLDRPEAGTGAPLAFKRSSVALRRASRASSSEVCVDTAFFLGEGGEYEYCAWEGLVRNGETHFSDTAASRSAKLLSILNRSFRAREKERAMVLHEAVNLCPLWKFGVLQHTIAACCWASSRGRSLRRTFWYMLRG